MPLGPKSTGLGGSNPVSSTGQAGVARLMHERDLPHGVSDGEFEAILARIKEADLKYWSAPFGEPDYKIRTFMGGKGLYFMEPDGHAWEILTARYPR